MKCSDIQIELAVYFDDILDQGERGMVDSHLAACPLCRARLAELQDNRTILRTAARVTPDDSLIASIRAAVGRTLSPQHPSPAFRLVEDRRPWHETWLMPSLVGSFASVLFGLSLLWLVLSPVNRQEMVIGRGGTSATYIASTNTNIVDGIDLSPLEFASTRLSVSGESPSVNPQGALIALSRSLVRGEMKDEEVVIVADVFGNGLARIAEVVEPKHGDKAILELRNALQAPSSNSPFVPASMDKRGESVRVVLKFQSVDVPVETPGL